MTTQDLLTRLSPLTDRVRRDVRAEKFQDGPRAQKLRLDAEALHNHVHGSNTYGAYPMESGANVTSVALLDFDSHRGEISFEGVCETLEQVTGYAYEMGLKPTCFRSSGGNGAHLYILWDKPQAARDVRLLMADLLAKAGLKNGAKGLVQGQVEIFPKQDKVGAGEWGNMFILPLAGKSVPLDPFTFEPLARTDYFEFRFSAPVKPYPVAKVVENLPQLELTSEDIHQLQDALAAIPNDGDGLDYHAWLECIFGIHHATGGSDEGKQIATAFSVRSDKFDEAFFENRIWAYIGDGSLTPDRKLTTAASIFWRARKAGWGPSAIDEFTAIVDRFTPIEEIPEPMDLWTMSDIPPLPDTAAPSFLIDYANQNALMAGQDPAGYLLFSVLAITGQVPMHVKINPKRNDTRWTEPVILWGVVVGDSGSGKTPMYQAAFKPIEDADLHDYNMYKLKLADWQCDYDAATPQERKAMLATRPKAQHRLISNSTTEAIFQACEQAYPARSVTMGVDELAGLIKGMNQYKGGEGSDRANMLEAYNGKFYKVARKGGDTMVPCFALTIAGGIQPERAKTVLMPGSEDGMMARFLSIVLTDANRLPTNEDLQVDPDLQQRYNALFKRINHLSEQTLRFDPQAQQRFNQSCKEANTLARLDQGHLKAWLEKWPTNLARLAAAFHIANWAWLDTDPDNFLGEILSQDIPETTINEAINFMIWVFHHTEAFYLTCAKTTQSGLLQAIGDSILLQEDPESDTPPATITRREIARTVSAWNDIKPYDQQNLIHMLHDKGWILGTAGRRPGSKRGHMLGDATAWTVNPRIFEHYDDQQTEAKQRKVARSQARAVWAVKRGKTGNASDNTDSSDNG
jgi:hypothetical protein